MEDIDMDEIDDYFAELRGERRGRATARTPGSGRRRKTPQTPALRGRSRSRSTAARQLSYPSDTKMRSASRSSMRSASRSSQGRMDPVLRAILSGNNKLYEKGLKRIKSKTRKVRHKNARTVLKKMPAGGKPYAKRRKSMRKPKGAYRGAVMPRWAKGETKHILINDACRSGATNAVSTTALTAIAHDGPAHVLSTVGETAQSIGELQSWCLNPIAQNNSITGRNGRQVDATYVRIQGHIRNNAIVTGSGSNTVGNKAYVRMLVLLVKGNRPGDDLATFSADDMFKKIDGSVVGYNEPKSSGTGAVGSGSAAVRTLQLPINKGLYTVLYDQKMQLANKGESFGSSDRLFDAKIPLKQKIKFADGSSPCSFQTNQLVYVVYSVDPECADAAPADNHIKLEFESKFSYKDF